MKTIIKSILLIGVMCFSISCYDESKLPYPEFQEGVSYRATPSPWASRPQLSLANPSQAITFKVFSYNPDRIAKVEIYATFLPATAMPGAYNLGSTASFANYVASNAPAGTAGLIVEVPDSGDLVPVIAYARYLQLISGSNMAAAPATPTLFPKLNRVLVRTLNSNAEALADQSFTFAELQTATGATVGTPVSTNIANQASFILVYEVTDVDGVKFSYANSGPSVIAGAATGRAIDKLYTITPAPVVAPFTKPYKQVISGGEGSPFIPAVILRVAP